MDCFYTSMAMIDAYYGNNRPPQYFKDLNGGEEGAKPADMTCIITSAGYTYEKVDGGFAKIGKAMNLGNPSIVGEISSGNIGHVTIPALIQLCGYGGVSDIRTSVMDPGYGRVMPRSNAYWNENFGLIKFIIHKK